MTVERLDHVGVVVDDLQAATEFFVALGLEPQGSGTVEGDWVDRIVGLEGVRASLVFVQTPDGHGQLEVFEFDAPGYAGDSAPEPANAPGLRHLAFAVDDVDETVARLRAVGAELVGEVVQYEDSYRLCYVRGPAGIIVELTQKLG
jgi:catechol 2,3-dioxygenase-like lactoylglutathione lyase family enzyme